ncbi:unnamed protein product [Didymodactylos carnosus]|uniref:Uncharacterized protein n=1 Tax=Didymodactylos carnosus TaxID=1234261 RepID=A0A814BQL8_9BILA|nr:unnamed protein product [Didymodactylos carnosus]CAF3707632.1 unnamed protein product [Didymodactylos carnosus]
MPINSQNSSLQNSAKPSPTIIIILLLAEQHHDEKFIQYDSDVKKLCYKYDPKLSTEQQLDLLKNDMKISLLEKISCLGICTPEKLFEIVQLYEADQQLIDSPTLQATSDSTTLTSQSSSIYPVSSTQHPSFTSLSPSYLSSSSQYYSYPRFQHPIIGRLRHFVNHTHQTHEIVQTFDIDVVNRDIMLSAV